MALLGHRKYHLQTVGVFLGGFLTALLGTKYITLITYKYNKHAVPKRENSERAIIAHARLPPDVTSVDIYKFT
jgi:hypothetical protein